MREIPEQDAEHFRCMLRTQTLPDRLLATYWQYKWLRDVLDGSRLQTPELALIAFLAGVEVQQAAEREISTLERLASGAYPDGHPLVVRWRRKQVPAVFLGVTAQEQVRVRLDGELEERFLQPDEVLEIAGQGA